jgi:hypothetical protein
MKTQKQLTIILLAFCFVLSTTLASWGKNATMELKKKSVPVVNKQVTLSKKRGLPDLVVSINTTTGLESGAKIPGCKVTVKNIGKAIAIGTDSSPGKGYMVDIMLSADGNIPMAAAMYSPNFHEDVLFAGGRISVTPDLKPGESKTFDLSNYLLIPKDTPSGSYCIGGFVDSQKKVKESNERNNTTCKRVKIKGIKPFQVSFPGMSHDFQIVSGKIKIKVVFNKSVNRASVIVGTNFKVKAEKILYPNGTLTWVDHHTLIWTSIKDYRDLLKFDSDGFFQLIIFDSVKDTTGMQLDGDNDGSAGGTFINDFVIIG